MCVCVCVHVFMCTAAGSCAVRAALHAADLFALTNVKFTPYNIYFMIGMIPNTLLNLLIGDLNPKPETLNLLSGAPTPFPLSPPP